MLLCLIYYRLAYMHEKPKLFNICITVLLRYLALAEPSFADTISWPYQGWAGLDKQIWFWSGGEKNVLILMHLQIGVNGYYKLIL